MVAAPCWALFCPFSLAHLGPKFGPNSPNQSTGRAHPSSSASSAPHTCTSVFRIECMPPLAAAATPSAGRWLATARRPSARRPPPGAQPSPGASAVRQGPRSRSRRWMEERRSCRPPRSEEQELLMENLALGPAVYANKLAVEQGSSSAGFGRARGSSRGVPGVASARTIKKRYCFMILSVDEHLNLSAR